MILHREIFDSLRSTVDSPLRGLIDLNETENACLEEWLECLMQKKQFAGKNKFSSNLAARRKPPRSVGSIGKAQQPDIDQIKDWAFESSKLWHAHLGDDNAPEGKNWKLSRRPQPNDVSLPNQSRLGLDSEQEGLNYAESNFLIHYTYSNNDEIELLAVSQHGRECWLALLDLLEKKKGYAFEICKNCGMPIPFAGRICECENASKITAVTIRTERTTISDCFEAEIVKAKKDEGQLADVSSYRAAETL